ncbi:FtsX-like permease family protein [Parashewanella spongiae]|uniref:FtsX-like permease family protein n=1 Tax=Parashewanella spongiae TaxID=342950 RepID=A0A3A6TFU1_9GAMM|nr:FtsX-like permease family protein [Parashewanella spongiae]MCL1079305.1 FtsX-like permease family protein [Parashewanella spongiae]RJY10523.1 FtsX-like permease family protein [Parashewanella spongiae]
MSEINLILNTHVAYFKRHPWLLLLFIVGLSLGSALLTAITGLNQEAKNRHHKSSALVDLAVSHIVKPPIGQKFIEGNLWLKLRKHGFTNAQPVLRGKLKLASGKTLYLQGIDSLIWMNKSAPTSTQQSLNQRNTNFAFDSILIDSNNGPKLQLESDSNKLQLLNSSITPSFNLVDDIGMWSITDIAYADMLLKAKGQLSFIEFVGLTPEQIPQIESILSYNARLVAAQDQDFDTLSEAFFFNLSALGLLGYIVAAFLSFNAIKLSIAGRKKLLTQFAILGCSPKAIRTAIVIEFTLMSFITALLGSIAGFVIANALVLDVNRTLMGLYKLEQALTIGWQWQTLALGFVINIATLAIMILTQKNTLQDKGSTVFYSALGSVITIFFYYYFNAKSEFDALSLCFCILLVFILITPKCLQSLLSFKNPFSSPLWQWLYADSKFQSKELRIAIVAILIALGSAIGMQIMVNSFSNTLNAHLEKQLSADVYIHLDKYDPVLRASLNEDSYINHVGIYMASKGYIDKIPSTLASFGQGHLAFSHISLTSGEKINASHFADNGCIANEQAAIIYNYQLGETVTFKQNQHTFECRISAFSYDYGNTSLGLITQEHTMKSSSLHWQVYGLSINLNEQITLSQLTERLINKYKIDNAYITENKRFKEIANGLFNDTFKVTKVLNGFILAIALVSLCISLLSLSAQHSKQLAVLNSLGVDSTQLHKLKLVQTTLLVGFTCVFAIPLGFALGFALLKFVMPIAFGWTIYFNLDLSALLITSLLLLFAAVLCAYLPVKKLTTDLHTKGS